MWESEINNIIQRKNSFLLLTAPVAWGKTQLVLKLLKLSSIHYLYISPLRALAEEFYQKAQESYPSFMLNGVDDRALWKKFVNNNRGILILTAERFSLNYWYDLLIAEKKNKKFCIIFDEFHLFYHWGESFRPKLWQCFIDLSQTNFPILALTATVNLELEVFCKKLLPIGIESAFFLNIGNHQLLYPPRKKYFFPKWSSGLFFKLLNAKLILKKEGTILCFCKYRRQVDQIYKIYKNKGFEVLSCKGGEVLPFIVNLSENPRPDLIVATSTLSHGVNLPPITAIFFAYAENDQDFWTQMVGRGGRRGESYDLYLLDKSFLHPQIHHRLLSFVHAVILILTSGVVDSIDFFLGQSRHANKS